MLHRLGYIICCMALAIAHIGCSNTDKSIPISTDSVKAVVSKDTGAVPFAGATADTGKIKNDIELLAVSSRVSPHELVEFGKTVIGVPYKYASSDPAVGFDCSGFITYVFNHFGVNVPRSSVDFTNAGREVDLKQAKEGDLILFTGTVDSIRVVGHMGIVTQNTDTLKFIHSTSGKANGVTISPFSEHYQKRFVKVVRVFG